MAFDPEHPWDLFLKAAGWPQYGQRVGFPDGTDTADGITVGSNPADKQVIVQLDKKHFNPAPGQRVCFYVLVGSQDGYGPDHFRPVAKEAGPWNLGGAENEDAPSWWTTSGRRRGAGGHALPVRGREARGAQALLRGLALDGVD